MDESSELVESEKIGLELDSDIEKIKEKLILKIVNNIFNLDAKNKANLIANLNNFFKSKLTREDIFNINEDDYTENEYRYFIIDKNNIDVNIIKIFLYLTKLIKSKYTVETDIEQYYKIFGTLMNKSKSDYLYNLFNIQIKCLLLDKENLFDIDCDDINLINITKFIGPDIEIKISSLHNSDILETIQNNDSFKSINNENFLKKNKDNIIIIINYEHEDEDSDDEFDF